MRKIFERFLYVLVLGLVIFLPGYATNIENLKGTFSILPVALRDFSPLDGAVAWHTGLIRRLYDFGHRTESEPVDKPQPKPDETAEEFKTRMRDWDHEYKNWLDRSPSSSIKAIVRNFFYRVPGTTGIADFKVSEKVLKGRSKTDFAKNIARGLVGIKIFKMLADLNLDKNVLNKLQIIQNIDPVKQLQIQAAFDDELFPGYEVVRYSLLAMLWFYCGDDRAALKVYFDHVKELLIKKINELLVKPIRVDIKKILKDFFTEVNAFNIPESWVAAAFSHDAVIAVQAYGTISDLIAPEAFEAFVYSRLMPVDKPEDVSYVNSAIITKGDFTDNFPDCVDTMVRNFFNHVLFSMEQKNFAYETLSMITHRAPRDCFVSFYQKYNNSMSASEKTVHNAWAEVISNIPWVAYNRVSTRPGELAFATYNGFMKVPSDISAEVRKFLNKNRYILIEDETAITYELMPNFRNVIIIFNYLLNLNIFKDEEFFDVFVAPDFIEKYLPKVIECFGSTSKKLDGFLGTVNILLNSISALNRKPYTVTFQVSTGHGQFKSEKITANTCPIFENINRSDLAVLPQSAIFLLSNSQFHSFFENADSSLEQLKFETLALFTQYIDQPGDAVDFVSAIRRLHEPLYPFLKFLVGRYPDEGLKFKALTKLYEKVVACGLNKYFEEVLLHAEHGAFNVRSDVRAAAYALWCFLFEHNMAFDRVRALANQYVNHPDLDMKNSALKLLISRGLCDEDAVRASVTLVESVDVQSFDLFWDSLFAKERCFCEGFACVYDMVNRDAESVAIWMLAHKLFAKLQSNSKYSESFRKIAMVGINSSYDGYQKFAMRVYALFIEKGLFFDDMLTVVSRALSDSNQAMVAWGISLLKDMQLSLRFAVIKNQRIDQAQKLIDNFDEFIRLIKTSQCFLDDDRANECDFLIMKKNRLEALLKKVSREVSSEI